MAPRPRILVGQKFSRLTVLAKAEGKALNGSTQWECVCICGSTTTVVSTSLTSGNTRSCGCLRKMRGVRVGRKASSRKQPPRAPTHMSYRGMKSRCLNENAANYKYYGGRGITICDRWLSSYHNFLEDMGERPEGMTIDRIDNDGNYEPSNCRWATAITQRGNKREDIA